MKVGGDVEQGEVGERRLAEFCIDATPANGDSEAVRHLDAPQRGHDSAAVGNGIEQLADRLGGLVTSGGASRVVTPCGSCRQLIAEAAQLANSDVRVLCCNGELSRIVVSKISELLPNAFGPENLGVSRQWPALREKVGARVAELTANRKRR